VPDSENAALVVDEVLSLLPKGWMSSARQLPGEEGTQLGQVKKDLGRLEAAPTNVRLSDTAAESLRTELGTHAQAVEFARSLANYRRGWREVKNARVILETPLPKTTEARVVARLLTIDAGMRAHDGDIDGALDSCLALFGVGRAIGDEPSLFAQTVRRAVGEVALKSARRALGQGAPSEAALSRFQAAILDELAQPSLLVAMRGERAALTERIRMVGAGEAPVVALRDSFNSKTNPRILPHPHAPWARLWFEYQRAATLDWMNHAVDIARRPASEQRSGWNVWQAKAKRVKNSQFGMYIEMLPLLFSPAVEGAGEAFCRYQADLGATIILIAAERHRQKTGDWPPSIESIDRSILPTAPVDPFSSKPFRIENRDGQFLIHSIGPNGDDEHGAYDPKRWLKGGPDDVGAGAWDVTLRAQPPALIESACKAE